MTRIFALWICGGMLCGVLGLAPRAAAADEWTTLPVPGAWEEVSEGRFANYDGFAWYRCQIVVPAAWREKPLSLTLGNVDNSYEVYWNGAKVGAAGVLPPDYRNGVHQPGNFAITPNQIQPGQPQQLALRVYDNDGRGGFKGHAPALMLGEQAISLAGKWQFRTGDDKAWAQPANAERAAIPSFQIVAAAPMTPAALPEEAVQKTRTGGLAPAEAQQKFTIAEGLKFDQVLAEPAVAQPVFLNFDERGRMWVVQYLQYPHPAGLKIVSRDNYWRNVYDKVPAAPPNHVRGRDKITIHTDTDGDGRYDKHQTFVDGLNMCTAVERGRGGVWVLNPPYLLFYPDRDNNDVPDGDPEVHLAGFGLEDSHSIANSLCWGPDGWLYAAQGSTVTGAIVRPGLDKQPVHSQGQLIWRYHPEQRRYEIFAEGGGNTFGCEIDAQGRIFSGHNGGDTRGFHYVQGGYLQKGFTKHGPLSNPYAFGYFPAMKHHATPRFSHNFLIYEGGALPDDYAGKLLGVEPLQSQLVLSEITPHGSTFQTRDLNRPVTSADDWFRPVDIKLGPDGGVYVADWYDGNVNHYRNHEGHLDPTNGRIYRLRAEDAQPLAPFDLSQKTSAELIETLKHPNRWFRRTALRVLGDRHDAKLAPELRRLARESKGQYALECLWALHLVGGLDEATTLELLAHTEPQVRLWTVRLVCDPGDISPSLASALREMVVSEANVEVRTQLAASARRLSVEHTLPIVRGLLAHREDLDDPQIPLLLWWAIEKHCAAHPDAVLALLNDRAVWSEGLAPAHVLERLMRRFATPGTQKDLLICAKLFNMAGEYGHANNLLRGFEQSLQGRSLAGLPPELVEALAAVGGGSLALRLRQGEAAAVSEALQLVADEKRPLDERVQYLRILGEVIPPDAAPVLLKLIGTSEDPALLKAALMSLAAYQDANIGPQVLARYAALPVSVRGVADSLLASRVSWAGDLFEAIEAGDINAADVSPDAIEQIRLLPDAKIAAQAEKLWGDQLASAAELEAEIRRCAELIRSENGNPYPGKKVFAQACAKCHTLFSEGGRVGPDLTTYQRDNLDNMLLHVIHPSAEIREGYENHLALTDQGRVVTGLLVDQDARVVILRGGEGQDVVLDRDQLDELKPQRRSLMPDGLLQGLTDQQIRDLFAYLRSTQPLND